MDKKRKFILSNGSKPDAWKSLSETHSTKRVKKYAGEVFADSKLDDGLYSIVDKKESTVEKELTKSQRILWAVGHLSLMATENYGIFYNKLHDYINRLIGKPETPNPDYDQDESHEKYIWSQAEADAYDEFILILREFQLEVSEPISNITKISANAFTRSVEKRRDRVLDTIKRTNKTAANSISRIPPSSTSLFGGDHSKLEKVVKLSKDLRGSGFNAYRNDFKKSRTYDSRSTSSKRGGFKSSHSGKSCSGYGSKSSSSKDRSFRGGNSKGGGKN